MYPRTHIRKANSRDTYCNGFWVEGDCSIGMANYQVGILMGEKISTCIECKRVMEATNALITMGDL